jgi:hypothetical protein
MKDMEGQSQNFQSLDWIVLFPTLTSKIGECKISSTKQEKIMKFYFPSPPWKQVVTHILSVNVLFRVSSSEAEGSDGVFSSQDSINVLDFRVPTGTGIKISRHGGVPVSIYSRGDSVYVGSTEDRLQLRGGRKSWVQHFSLRRGKLVASYELPILNSDYRTSSVSQVWGNSNHVMGVCGKGFFVFDALKDGAYATGTVEARETIGTDTDLQRPTFDYSGSRLLLVSRDRPALWRFLS